MACAFVVVFGPHQPHPFLSGLLYLSWWRHQMETFSALLALCAGNSPVTGEFPAWKPVTRSLDVSFDLRQNKMLNKQSWGWWFKMSSHSLWRHRNVSGLQWLPQCQWSNPEEYGYRTTINLTPQDHEHISHEILYVIMVVSFCCWSEKLLNINSLWPSDAYMRQKTNHHQFR